MTKLTNARSSWDFIDLERDIIKRVVEARAEAKGSKKRFEDGVRDCLHRFLNCLPDGEILSNGYYQGFKQGTRGGRDPTLPVKITFNGQGIHCTCKLEAPCIEDMGGINWAWIRDKSFLFSSDLIESIELVFVSVYGEYEYTRTALYSLESYRKSCVRGNGWTWGACDLTLAQEDLLAEHRKARAARRKARAALKVQTNAIESIKNTGARQT